MVDGAHPHRPRVPLMFHRYVHSAHAKETPRLQPHAFHSYPCMDRQEDPCQYLAAALMEWHFSNSSNET
jgi:hypothetical protein